MVKRKFIVLKTNLMEKLINEHRDYYIESRYLKTAKNVFDGVIQLNKYNGFQIINFNNILNLIIDNDNSHLFKYNDLIDVTNNPYYKIDNIMNNLIINSNIVIEGSDGVGKTTIVKELANSGIITQDREIEYITKKMRKEVSKEDRLASVSDYLKSNQEKKVVFLYMSDEEELIKRVSKRGTKSIYDSNSLEYNELYHETYQSLSNYNNLYLIDCYMKDVSQVLNELKSIVNNKGEKCNIIK